MTPASPKYTHLMNSRRPHEVPPLHSEPQHATICAWKVLRSAESLECFHNPWVRLPQAHVSARVCVENHTKLHTQPTADSLQRTAQPSLTAKRCHQPAVTPVCRQTPYCLPQECATEWLINPPLLTEGLFPLTLSHLTEMCFSVRVDLLINLGGRGRAGTITHVLASPQGLFLSSHANTRTVVCIFPCELWRRLGVDTTTPPSSCPQFLCHTIALLREFFKTIRIVISVALFITVAYNSF